MNGGMQKKRTPSLLTWVQAFAVILIRTQLGGASKAEATSFQNAASVFCLFA